MSKFDELYEGVINEERRPVDKDTEFTVKYRHYKRVAHRHTADDTEISKFKKEVKGLDAVIKLLKKKRTSKDNREFRLYPIAGFLHGENDIVDRHPNYEKEEIDIRPIRRDVEPTRDDARYVLKGLGVMK
jgi:hypothetical protein